MTTMFDRILEIPAQLRWGTSLTAPEPATGRPAVLLGMGGSGMAAAVAALEAEGSGSVVATHRSYGLPPWAGPAGALVVAVSYSGNTEETLSGVEEALELRLPVVAVTSGGTLATIAANEGFPHVEVPGGLQPRAALGYQAAATIVALAGGGYVEHPAAVLEEAAEVVADLLGDGEGAAVALGRDLAQAAEGRIPIVYGGHPVAALAAYRFKTQINENAKRPAWSAEVPEMNHNELQGWAEASTLRDCTGVIYLRDRYDHPRIARRLDLMEVVLRDQAERLGTVISEGTSAVARFFSLCVVGDVMSVEMARRDGVDPTPVVELEDFKTQLGKEPT